MDALIKVSLSAIFIIFSSVLSSYPISVVAVPTLPLIKLDSSTTLLMYNKTKDSTILNLILSSLYCFFHL